MNSERCASCLQNPPVSEDVVILHLKQQMSNVSLQFDAIRLDKVYFCGLVVERKLWAFHIAVPATRVKELFF